MKIDEDETVSQRKNGVIFRLFSTENLRFTWVFYNKSGKDYFFTIYFLATISRRKS